MMNRSEPTAKSSNLHYAGHMHDGSSRETPMTRYGPDAVLPLAYIGLSLAAGPVLAVTSCEEWGGSASFGLDPLVIDMRLAEMRDSGD